MTEPSGDAFNSLKAHYRRWEAGDWTDGSIFDRHAVGIFPDPTPRPQYGREALSQYMRRFLEGWKDISIEAESFQAIGDSFLVVIRRRGIGRRSGVPIDDRAFHLWTFRGTKAIRLELFERESDALAPFTRTEG